MEIIIEGDQVFSEQDFHSQLAKQLGIQEFYGCNLDALWDLLSASVERPLVLIWKNHKVSKQYIGDRFNRIIKVLEDVKLQDESFGWKEGFTYSLE